MLSIFAWATEVKVVPLKKQYTAIQFARVLPIRYLYFFGLTGCFLINITNTTARKPAKNRAKTKKEGAIVKPPIMDHLTTQVAR